MYGAGMRLLVYQAIYTKLGTTHFCISLDESFMYLTPKDNIQIYAEAIGAVGVLEQHL